MLSTFAPLGNQWQERQPRVLKPFYALLSTQRTFHRPSFYSMPAQDPQW